MGHMMSLIIMIYMGTVMLINHFPNTHLPLNQVVGNYTLVLAMGIVHSLTTMYHP